MKTLFLTMTLGVLTLCVQSEPSARADGYSEFQGYLTTQLRTLNSTINAEADNDASCEDYWFLRRFLLRLRPQVALDLVGFGNLKLMPEVELVWERTYPDGWETYKP